VNPPTQHTHTHTHTTLRSICITCLLVGRVCMGVITLWNNCFSPKHTGHNYWLPVIKYFLPSPFAKTTVLSFFYNARWVWRTDQRSFLHTESLQILQIHKFMVVFLLSSSLHSSYRVQVRRDGNCVISNSHNKTTLSHKKVRIFRNVLLGCCFK